MLFKLQVYQKPHKIWSNKQETALKKIFRRDCIFLEL